MTKQRIVKGIIAGAFLFGGCLQPTDGSVEQIQEGQYGVEEMATDVVPVEQQAPLYVTGKQKGKNQAALLGDPIIRSYRDSVPWFGENRDNASLLHIGKAVGQDYFIHPVSDLATGIPTDTSVVLLPSNGRGSSATSSRQNGALDKLEAFLADGGTAIVSMGDNDRNGGYRAPGSTGTPSYNFPSPCRDATLAAGALGKDGILGTADDHPIVKGPDGVAGTADDLNNGRIDLASSCSVAHGNLADGITLPEDATILATATFNGVQKPVMAEYCHNGGRVILDTFTKEFTTHQGPQGTGSNRPTYLMINLFSYALSSEAKCGPTAVCEDLTLAADDSCQACGSIDAGSFDPAGGNISVSQSPECHYGLGATDVTLTVTDGNGASSTCNATVSVEDRSAPSAAVNELGLLPYPRDFQKYEFTLADCAAIEADNCDADLDINRMGRIVSIESDEADVYYHNDPANDIELLDNSTFRLRNQRDSYGNGRIYRVNFTVTDNAGNESEPYTCTFGVKVFDDGGCHDTPIDDGDVENLVLP